MKTGPRYIKPETVTIGDTIRATIKNGDVEVTTVGTVAKRERTRNATEYVSAAGVTIVETYFFDDRHVTITLLDRPADRHPTLDIEGL